MVEAKPFTFFKSGDGKLYHYDNGHLYECTATIVNPETLTDEEREAFKHIIQGSK